MSEIDSKHWMYISLLLGIMILANSAMIFYTSLTPNQDVKQLQNQIASLEEKIRDLSSKLGGTVYINGSDNALIPSIYDATTGSIAVIENRLQTSQGLEPQALGSGFVYRADSSNQYLVTNNHVVENASDILVTFRDGNSSKATVVGTDVYSDLALIKLSTNMYWLKSLPLGKSSDLIVGQTVLAFGSPFGLSGTLTSGIVSQLGRDLETDSNYRIVDVIQLDAAINPGNSGGPLLNLDGEVVGMNTAIISGSNTSSGVGFAIPSDTIRREAPSLIANGTYSHPYLGVSGFDVNYDIGIAAGLNVTYGFLIASVTAGGPADLAGIIGGDRDVTVLGQVIRIGGDLIVGVNGLRVRQLDDLSAYVERNCVPGNNVALTIIRGNKKLLLTLTLGVRPPQ